LTTEKQLEKGISDIVGVFTDPVIVMPGGWGDDLPDWLKQAITLERLIANIEGLKTGKMTATDAEACAYLFTASLEAPLDHDWAQIYFYVATRVYERHRTKDSGVTMPEDIRVTELTRDQERDLSRLKDWIYATRLKYRKAREHDQRKEARVEREAHDELEVVQLSFDLGRKE